MNKFFIARLFIVVMLIATAFSPAFSALNNHSQTPPPVAKPLPAKPVQPRPTFRAYHKPTHEDTVLMRDKSINGQYKYLLTKLYGYQHPFVTSLYKSMLDTMKETRTKLQEAEAKLAAQSKTTSALQNDVSEKQKSLEESNSRVNSVNFLGIYIDKSVYNLIMWGLVIVLGATAAVVIFRSGSLGREARYRINLYNELEEEFKTYKVKANEKEKKLARELQTERNKVDELMGRS